MTNIDLSKYIGKKVKCTFDNKNELIGVVCKDILDSPYPYTIGVRIFQKNGAGWRMGQIKTIEVISDKKAIAQCHPNINLNDFEGQLCYVKWNEGTTALCMVWCDEPDLWNVGLDMGLSSDGGGYPNPSHHITEIYGEGAYEIKTKDTFDEPTDNAVEKAKEVIKDLSEEQIAKLLHSLKK
jgi:hypothetical protein